MKVLCLWSIVSKVKSVSCCDGFRFVGFECLKIRPTKITTKTLSNIENLGLWKPWATQWALSKKDAEFFNK